MGLFDFLGGGNKAGAAKKQSQKANNKDAQSVDRFKALEALVEDGTGEAIEGLLRRMTWNYDKSIDDESEKQWVHDTLVDVAQANADDLKTILGALENNLCRAETIAWQLKVLEHVASHDEAWPILVKVIANNDNEYVRDPSRKIQLIDFLGEWDDPRAAAALAQWLEDRDEGVRFKTIEAMFHKKDEEHAREPLLKLLVKPEEESRRIKLRILDGLADVEWNTHGYKGTVEKLCEDLGRGHSIDGKGRVRKGKS